MRALASGGVTTGGGALVSRNMRAVIGGGVHTGGAAQTANGGAQTFPYTGSGGVTLAGHAPAAAHWSLTSSGGVRTGGSALVSRRFAFVPAGGLSTSGTAATATRRAWWPSGGVAIGGAAITDGPSAASSLVGIPRSAERTIVSASSNSRETFPAEVIAVSHSGPAITASSQSASTP
jgi:hypothetical protein